MDVKTASMDDKTATMDDKTASTFGTLKIISWGCLIKESRVYTCCPLEVARADSSG